jgi:hypothetical protein
VFVIGFVTLWLSAEAGAALRKTKAKLAPTEQGDLELILNATLTLFALVIGFSFSMATGRYDQRKALEAEETTAIGSEYPRLGLLAPGDTARARHLLRDYLGQRVAFYGSLRPAELKQVSATTVQLQDELWSVIGAPVATQPNAVQALIIKGMNDVEDAEVRAQAAYWNRIPLGAWALMVVIGLCCNVMFGYKANIDARRALFLALPLIFSVAFFLLADLDSPRAGLITVRPQDLERLSARLNTVGQ